MRKYILVFLSFVFFFAPSVLFAQEFVQDKTEVVRSRVLKVLSEEYEDIGGTGIQNIIQSLEVKILEGTEEGKVLQVENDYIKLKAGDTFFLYHSIDAIDAVEAYSVRDIDRTRIILFFIVLFIGVVVSFSGKKGLRSLLGLAGSFVVILYILIPSLLAGYPPMLTSTVVATLILFFAIYLTHGFNRISTVAFLGTVLAVLFTGFIAYVGVTAARFTGLVNEEAFYLNLNTRGTLNLTGLLLGGIMIGVLGVLDDIAITQSAIVRELYQSASHLSKREVYKKALSVGKEHVSALVNTLALAYTGASLPLLLLFHSNSAGASVLNQEVFATEIIRTIAGSIGLILTVPITTFLAVHWLKGYKGNVASHSHGVHSH